MAMRACLDVKDNVYQDQTDGNYITILVAPGHGPPTLGSHKNFDHYYISYNLYKMSVLFGICQ